MGGISFGDLTEGDKARYLAEYRAGGIAALRQYEWNTEPDYIRRQLTRWEAGGRRQRPPSPTAPQSHDFDAWLSSYGKRFMRVMHLCDIHWPYQDDNALSLAYNLVDHVQPVLVVVGSDSFDFDLLTSFRIDPDYSEDEDELDRMQRYWLPHINTLNNIVPSARFVFLEGNHEARMRNYVIDHAPQLRQTIWRRYVEIIRCDGRVDWLGEVDRVEVGDVLIAHGNRYGIYPAKGLLDDVGYQCHVQFGHNHRLTFFSKQGQSKYVEAHGSGCLRTLDPHYKRGTKMRNKWHHGTTIMDIDIRHERATGFNNLRFAPDGDGLVTRLGFTSITS